MLMSKYFTKETEAAVIRYNKAKNKQSRNKIFEEELLVPIAKIAENMVNRYKWPFILEELDNEQLQTDCLSYLSTRLPLFKPGRGKAFSFLSICCKNYLVQWNNRNYRKAAKTEPLLTDIDNLDDALNKQQQKMERNLISYANVDWTEFNQLFHKFITKHKQKIAFHNKKYDIALDAILKLLDDPDALFSGFNKPIRSNKRFFFNVLRHETEQNRFVPILGRLRKLYKVKLQEYLALGYLNQDYEL